MNEVVRTIKVVINVYNSGWCEIKMLKRKGENETFWKPYERSFDVGMGVKTEMEDLSRIILSEVMS